MCIPSAGPLLVALTLAHYDAQPLSWANTKLFNLISGHFKCHIYHAIIASEKPCKDKRKVHPTYLLLEFFSSAARTASKPNRGVACRLAVPASARTIRRSRDIVGVGSNAA
eukprot:365847-Chlamydomonas_euryale.AAC.12